MKKLMIALAAVAVAAGVQAASFTWANTSINDTTLIYDGAGTATKLYNNATTYTAYLFCANDISQAELLAAVRKDGASALTANAIGGNSTTTLNTASKITKTAAFDYGTYVEGQTTTYDFFYAILDADNDKMLISILKEDQLAQKASTTAISFGSSSTWSDTFKGDADFSAAGWYSTVPEPTSGLLLLLGVAGLALRRRRA